MAENSDNILKRLQNFEVEPPVDAYQKAWESISENNAAQEPAVELTAPFSQLQSYELTPPPIDIATITRPASPWYKQTWLRAAAVLLLLGSALTLYFISGKKQQQDTSHAPGHYRDSSAPGNTNAGANLIKDTSIQKEQRIAVSPPVFQESNKRIIPAKAENKTMLKDNNVPDLFEDDLLLTLVNFKEPQWKNFLAKAVAEKRIVLNQYSSCNLSDAMVKMLAELNEVKENGKPSRKARKTRRRFERWKKKDEKFFDRTQQKNPLDIIDLSEFILK